MQSLVSLRMNSLSIALVLLAGGALAAEKKISFSRQIKPILAGKCFACHGPDDKERKADLRLDVRDAGVADVIKAGKSQESELIARVTSSDPEKKMPPAGSKKPALSTDEIALIRRWIDQGAEYDSHWAYQKPAPPPAPAVKAAAWPVSAIDQFILAGLEENGLAPAADADQRTVLRRLYFDIIGLPPTPQEMAEFESDKSSQAYEKVVDKLLASKHFGERMAMYWLDIVRFADTAGYHSDNHRDVALFRDYVIDAFNNNKPFDRFTIEQLAGDLLPNLTREQRIASGYNRLLQTTEEGGAQAKEYTAKYAADRVRNTSAVWLASTMGCCECHNHKFDPFTTRDFYSLEAFFADVAETPVGRQGQTKVPTPEQEAQLKQFDDKIAQLQSQLNTQTPELDAALARWEALQKEELTKAVGAWIVVKPEKADSTGGSTLQIQDDASVLSSGANPAQDSYTVTLSADGLSPDKGVKVTGLRLEALTHDSLANKGLSRANGNFVLTGVTVTLVSPDGKTLPLKIKSAEADFSQADYPITNAIDANPNTGWAVNGHIKPENHQAIFTLAEPAAVAKGEKLVVQLLHQSTFAQHNMGRFRLSLTAAAKPRISNTDLPLEIAQTIKLEAVKRTDDQKQKLAAYFRGVAAELALAREELKKLSAERKALDDSLPQSLVTMSAAPRMIRILPRGNWLDDSGTETPPAVPQFLTSVVNIQPSAKEPKRLTRLDLANWLTHPDHPLTARVFVNRLWKLAFGRGITRSMEDFGTQGEYPSHPELLDWLAIDFREHGWDVKRAFKQILMSRAYRQSSAVSKELREKDPTNHWFSRQDRFRLDAELVRDNALAISGLLSRKIGGPSVKPYQPAGYWQFLNFPTREWQNDHGEDLYRRGMYTYWQRTFVNPSLLAFDAPSREECTVARTRSNTPQQALVLLNDPTYVEAARALAARAVQETTAEPAKRLEFLFQQALVRAPRVEEVKLLLPLYEKHLKEYQADLEAARKLLAVGESKPRSDLNPSELAAWTSIARVVLNLHETITRN